MSTITQTYTRVDVRRVFENFQADLQMLAVRTQAMESDHAKSCGDDVCLMAQAGCLSRVHVHLYDSSGKRVRVHCYSVKDGVSSVSSRPGGNRWPCLPNGTLCVIVDPSDGVGLEKLKISGMLKLIWTASSLSTDYSNMRIDGTRLYFSNSFGLQRDTFVN